VIATVWVMLLLSLAGCAAVWVHLANLPVAPACPHCRSVTDQPRHATVLDRLFGAVANAVARECPRCGWAGRMKWRLAPGRTRAG
jgi:hypothetical protein